MLVPLNPVGNGNSRHLTQYRPVRPFNIFNWAVVF